MTLFASPPNQYSSSRQLIAGSDFNNVVQQLNSLKSGITAFAGGGQAGATQLDSAINTIATVVTAADSVKLSKGFPGLEMWVVNEDADAVQVFGYGSDTIDGVAFATGVSQAQGKTIYKVNKYDPVTKIANWVSK